MGPKMEPETDISHVVFIMDYERNASAAGLPDPEQKSRRLDFCPENKSSRVGRPRPAAGFNATGLFFCQAGWAITRLVLFSAGQRLAGDATGFLSVPMAFH